MNPNRTFKTLSLRAMAALWVGVLVLNGCGGAAPTPTNVVPVLVTVSNKPGAVANSDGSWTVGDTDQIVVTCNTAAKKCKWTLQTENASLNSTATEAAYQGKVIATQSAGRIVLSAYADNYVRKDLVFIVQGGIKPPESTTDEKVTCTEDAAGKTSCTMTTTTCTATATGQQCTVITKPVNPEDL